MRIEKAEAGKAKLQEQIKKLEAEVAAMDAGTAEALKIRQEEHEEYVSPGCGLLRGSARVCVGCSFQARIVFRLL